MKYIKKFNEALIHPPKLENDFIINSFDDLVEYGIQNDFDVFEYNEFFDSLGENDKKTAPPNRGIPFFALFHPDRKKAMFVICDKMVIKMIPNFKSIVNDIIGHELIHKEQTNRRGNIEFNLPNPTNRKEYFSNKEEIMAFSWSIANELSRESGDLKDAISKLDKSDTISRMPSQWKQLWRDINRFCDSVIIKRYRKYIYMYLSEMQTNF